MTAVTKNSDDKRQHNVFKSLQLSLLPKPTSVGAKKNSININIATATPCSMEILGQLRFRRINNELKCQIILWKHPVMQMPLKGKRETHA